MRRNGAMFMKYSRAQAHAGGHRNSTFGPLGDPRRSRFAELPSQSFNSTITVSIGLSLRFFSVCFAGPAQFTSPALC